MKVVAALGRWVLDFLHSTGEAGLLFGRSAASLITGPWYLPQLGACRCSSSATGRCRS